MGATLRLASLAVQARMPLEPDAQVYLRLAADMDVTTPWAASLREPLWVLLVKAWCTVFGYDALPLRVMTTLLGVAALAVGTAFFRSHLGRRQALIAAWVLAMHGLLVLSAGRGLREDLVGLLVLFCVWLVLSARSRPGHRLTYVVAALVAALAGIRLEVGLLVLGLLAAAVLLRQVAARAALLGLLGVVLVVAPWLHANAGAYGDAFASSNDGASFWSRADEFGAEGVDPSGTAPAPPASATSWTDYYFDDLGPLESARRVSLGAPGLQHDSLATGLWPLKERWLTERVDDAGVRRLGSVVAGAADLLAWLLLALVAVGLARRSSRSRVVAASSLVAVCGVLPYAALRELPYFEERFISSVVSFSVLLAVAGCGALAHRDPDPSADPPSPLLSKEPAA